MNKVKIFLLMASMVFAVIFAFSCSSNNSPELVAQSSSSEDMAQSSSSEWTAQSSSSEGTAHSSSSKWTAQSSSSEEMVQSSSSEWTAQSSSSETSSVSLCAGEEYDPDIFRCEYGELVGKCAGRDYYPAYQICEGGVIKNKNEPSSSSELSLPSSSSSSIPSSSSIELSSSSTVVSSSSSIPSSSSVVLSSSSAVVSSSNSMPSSSSSACTAADNTQTHYCSNGAMKEYGFVDYGGQRYKTVEIGEQVWFAENLNYDALGSVCYNNNSAYCVKYGRLYDWSTAMDLPASCNSSTCLSQIQSKHKGICPNGWHIPSQAEWNALMSYVESNSGCSNCAAVKLKATSGWSNYRPPPNSVPGSDSYLCEDTYGFSALPGGYSDWLSGYGSIGEYGHWWSAKELQLLQLQMAYHIQMGYLKDNLVWDYTNKPFLRSVRCLQN